MKTLEAVHVPLAIALALAPLIEVQARENLHWGR
jgi:hypothetical protein